jgi:hypothetical protein
MIGRTQPESPRPDEQRRSARDQQKADDPIYGFHLWHLLGGENDRSEWYS